MTQFQKISLFTLRVATGWLMLYAGITKLMDPNWSAVGYLQGAKTFTGFYSLFTGPSVLPVINLINEWGLTLLGISLILGIFVRLSSILGVALMLLYYFPVLEFPYIPGAHAFLIDEHIIYTLVLLTLASLRAGRVFGLENWCTNLPICARYPKLREWLG